jgi:hypothetical protein
VQDDLRAVLGLDDDVRLGQAALEVAALVAARVSVKLLALDRVVGSSQRLELLPLDSISSSAARACRRVRRDRRDGGADVAGSS